MKKTTLFFVAVVALGLPAASTSAADLPTPAYLPPPPMTMWTGFYFGLNAGGAFGGDNAVNTITGRGIDNPAAFLFAPFGFGLAANSAALGTGSLGTSNGGFIGGGQVGYNYQLNSNFVAGIEADIQGVAGATSSNSAANAVASDVGGNPFSKGLLVSTLSSSRSLDSLGTVRGRIGYLFAPTLLVYATGGLAYGQANTNTSIWQAGNYTFTLIPFGFPIPSTSNLTAGGGAFGTFSDTRVGWTVGGGLEWMFLPNWSAKIEYLYYDLGRVTNYLSPLALTATESGEFSFSRALATVDIPTSSTRFNGNIVRVGLSYHFSWGAAPVIASYQ